MSSRICSAFCAALVWRPPTTPPSGPCAALVIARKVWAGSRSWNGARTHQIRATVLGACRQQGQDAFARIVGLLRSPVGKILGLAPNARAP